MRDGPSDMLVAAAHLVEQSAAAVAPLGNFTQEYQAESHLYDVQRKTCAGKAHRDTGPPPSVPMVCLFDCDERVCRDQRATCAAGIFHVGEAGVR